EQKTAALNEEMQARSRVEQAVLEISGQEQRRIAHELHDGLGQHLTYAAFKAKMLAEDLNSSGLPQARPAEEIVQLLNQGTQQVRTFARGLDPIDVEASGLTAALERLVKETEALGHIRCGFTFSRVDLPLEPFAGLQIYRIAQEALNNTVKHGKSRCVEVELNVRPGELSLKITDDGIGFDVMSRGNQGMGIEIMRYRARRLGGVLEITSAPNQGTTVHCLVPGAILESPGTGSDPGPTNPHAQETYSRG
ncbi:MAG: sensor histidine kinase, partial [Verrucomicrobia bacterium]|nr:sensor histidine kinase [Verrucomicrobiota bacterium]